MGVSATPPIPVPDISFPNTGGSPYSSVCTTVSPNQLYIGSQNYSTAYYNCRAGGRTQSAPTNSTTWFTIPANASCELVIWGFRKRATYTETNNRVALYLANTSGVTVASIDTGSHTYSSFYVPKVFTKTFTTGSSPVDIGMIYVRGYSATKQVGLDVELYVNGVMWLGAKSIASWLYHFNDNILSSTTHDLGVTGVVNYAPGVYGDAYYRKLGTEGDASTDPLGLYTFSSTDYPTWSNNNFTISMWEKGSTNMVGHMFGNTVYTADAGVTWDSITATMTSTGTANGWSVSKQNSASKIYSGIRLGFSSGIIYMSFVNDALAYGCVFRLTPPSDFDTTVWHHYAMTRFYDNIYFFVDGVLIFYGHFSYSATFYSTNHIAIGCWLSTDSADGTPISVAGSEYIDDFYINVGQCKWFTDFDTSSIVY